MVGPGEPSPGSLAYVITQNRIAVAKKLSGMLVNCRLVRSGSELPLRCAHPKTGGKVGRNLGSPHNET